MYRILIVDKDPEMLAAARLFIERDRGIAADTTISPACALAKLAVNTYDAIVSDYPVSDTDGMDGITFLREVRSKYAALPFIIMTGRPCDEAVTEAVKSGATGYLQKGADIVGTFTELLHLIRNAAGKCDAERALAESEDRYNDIMENAHDLIHRVRPDGRFLTVNRTWRQALGYTAEDTASMTVFDIIAPEALDAYMEMFASLLRGVSQEGFETVFLTKDGRRVHVRGNINCRMEGGIPRASYGTFRSLSGIREDEAEIQTLLSAVRNLPLPLLFTDKNGTIVRANGRAHRLFGQNTSSLTGVDVRQLFLDPSCWDRIQTVIHTRGEWVGQAAMQVSGDRECTCSLCCAAANGSGGDPGVISVAFSG